MPRIGQFQIVFMRDGGSDTMDRMVIRIEQDGAVPETAQIVDDIIRRVREAVSLRPGVEFVARGTLYDHERSIKARRVLDLRSTE